MTEPKKRITEVHDVTFADVLGKVLRSLRVDSQQVVAARAGLGQSTVSRVECGAIDITMGDFRRLCAALGHQPVNVLSIAEAAWARL